MQTSKKRIYGALGLASVAAMTVAAYNVPTPVAYAQTSQDVPLTVTVYADNLSIGITGGIKDGAETAISPAEIQATFSHTWFLDYYVSVSQDGVTKTDVVHQTIDASTLEGVTDQGDGYGGTYTASIDLEQILADTGFDPAKDADFTFKIVGSSRYGGIKRDDSITFTYGQIAVDPGGNIKPDAEEGETNVPTVENGDPIISVETGEEVKTIHVVVTNPETGEIVWEGDVPAGDDITNITLPFADNNVKSGDYTITVYAYDNANRLVGSSSFTFYYAQPIGLPNTGGSIFEGLNMGRTDFLISGLLVFGIVSGAGLFLMNRSKKSNGRTRK